MERDETEERIDRLSIQEQLELLARNLTESRKKLELSNLLWERVLAAEEFFKADEVKLFDSAADVLIDIRSRVGFRRKRQRRS